MPDVDWSKLKKFFQEKRYSEIVLDIETSTTEKNRPPALLNLLGVCRASQKGKTDRDIKYALNDFENAFYKDGLGENPSSLQRVPHSAGARKALTLSFILTTRYE